MRLRARGAAQHAGWEHTRGERGLSTARRTLNVDSVVFVLAVERSSRARKRRDESRPLAASKTRAPSRLRAPTRQARLAPPPEGEGASRLATSLSRGGASLACRQYGRAARASTHGCSGKLPAAESCTGNGCSAPRTTSESRLGSAVSGLSCPGPRRGCRRGAPVAAVSAIALVVFQYGSWQPEAAAVGPPRLAAVGQPFRAHVCTFRVPARPATVGSPWPPHRPARTWFRRGRRHRPVQEAVRVAGPQGRQLPGRCDRRSVPAPASRVSTLHSVL